MATQPKIAPLRPAQVRSRPIRIERVFDDPQDILRRVAERGPYQTTARLHQLGETLGAGAARAPWFKSYVEDPDILWNERWIDAAKRAFDASIVKPLVVALNLNAATPLGVPHLDLPSFRGLTAQSMPAWLLLNMAHSGLFHDWMAPYASGLCWFNADTYGAFEYWPKGLDHPSEIEEAPMWNRGIVSDNEFMWHRVHAIGSPEEQEQVKPLMDYNNMLEAMPDGCWEMRRGETSLKRFGPTQIRISLLWKAHVFTDEAHLASFEDERLNLTLDHVVDLYCAELAARGANAATPSDPLGDDGWRELLQREFAPPIQHLA